jgi:hypothetical protein
VGDVCDPDGIPPLVQASAAPRDGERHARRRELLRRLSERGVLDEVTVGLALRAA